MGSEARRMWKLLKDGRRTTYGDEFWPPIGQWTPIRSPILCQSGWHLWTCPYEVIKQLGTGFYGSSLYEAEGKGKSAKNPTKTAFEQARLKRAVKVNPAEAIIDLLDWINIKKAPEPYKSEISAYITGNSLSKRSIRKHKQRIFNVWKLIRYLDNISWSVDARYRLAKRVLDGL